MHQNCTFWSFPAKNYSKILLNSLTKNCLTGSLQLHPINLSTIYRVSIKGRRSCQNLTSQMWTKDGYENFHPKSLLKSFKISVTFCQQEMGLKIIFFNINDVFLPSDLIKMMSFYCLIQFK